MRDFDLSINIILLLILLGISLLAALGIQRKQIAKKNRKIAELENEVVDISAEILEVQKEYCALQASISPPDEPGPGDKIPVIPIKSAEKNKAGKRPDGKVNSPPKKSNRDKTA